MIARLALFTIIAGCTAAAGQTQALCPWLSTGSAVTALGGDVMVTAHSDNNWQGSCYFTRQTAGATLAIDIQVSRAPSHPCPDGSTKLKALGNEAVQCLRLAAGGQRTDIIAGRARDAYFEITMTGALDATGAPTSNTRADEPYGASLLERIAEQVVGNLY